MLVARQRVESCVSPFYTDISQSWLCSFIVHITVCVWSSWYEDLSNNDAVLRAPSALDLECEYNLGVGRKDSRLRSVIVFNNKVEKRNPTNSLLSIGNRQYEIRVDSPKNTGTHARIECSMWISGLKAFHLHYEDQWWRRSLGVGITQYNLRWPWPTVTVLDDPRDTRDNLEADNSYYLLLWITLAWHDFYYKWLSKHTRLGISPNFGKNHHQLNLLKSSRNLTWTQPELTPWRTPVCKPIMYARSSNLKSSF